jgi:cysteine desulfurase/selenocysteine lyase
LTVPHAPPVRRYLDNAATTWPKPEVVLEAWLHAARDVGATAGRAAYADAVAADAIRDRARRAAARLLGGVDPRRVAFPAGGTLALNMALLGLLRPGDHAIATAADHNAVLRPLEALRAGGVIDVTIVPCDGAGRVDPAAIAAAWRPATRLVTCTHASNVTGARQDAAAIAAIAHDHGGLLLLDAAQTLGQTPCTTAAWGADVVCAPAHKWLLGTGGLGLLWAREGLALEPLVRGGTGSASESLAMPEAFTERMEAGTPDVPALAALAAAADWLEQRSVAAVGEACGALAAAAAARLAEAPGVRVIAGPGAPIVSVTVAGYEPADVAAVVEQVGGVQVRAGLHCAALVHEHLGTAGAGTVRASFGPFNTAADVDALVTALAAVAAG